MYNLVSRRRVLRFRRYHPRADAHDLAGLVFNGGAARVCDEDGVVEHPTRLAGAIWRDKSENENTR